MIFPIFDNIEMFYIISEISRLSWTKYNLIYFAGSRNISICRIKSLELVHQGNTSDISMYNLIHWVLYFCILLMYAKNNFLSCYQYEKILKKGMWPKKNIFDKHILKHIQLYTSIYIKCLIVFILKKKIKITHEVNNYLFFFSFRLSKCWS